MIKKFKCIKKFPYGPEVGMVGKIGANGDVYMNAWRLSLKEVESSPEYFAPFVFTTLDDVGIYVGDTYYFIDSSNEFYLTGKATTYSDIRVSGKVFSTREAAQSYIDSLKKPIWKTEDGYDVFDGDNVKWVIYRFYDKMWEYIYDLPLCNGNLICVQKQPETYKVFKDEDKMKKWIEEQNKPEYVECTVSPYPEFFTVGKIYEWPNPTDDEGDVRQSAHLLGCYTFKPSTKEEYDLQQFKDNSKQVTITVDGQVTSVSAYGSEVRINYQVK